MNPAKKINPASLTEKPKETGPIVARYNEIIEASYASLESQIRKQEEKVELAARLLKKRKKVLKSMQEQRIAVQMKKKEDSQIKL